MNHKLKTKIFTIGQVSLFITLILLSTSLAGAKKDFEYFEAYDPIISHNGVKITLLQVTEISTDLYDIDLVVHNFYNYDVTVEEVLHTYIYPDGGGNSFTMGPWLIEAHSYIGVTILNQYPTGLYGTYTWITTLKDASGAIIDEKSISWERTESK